MHQGCPVGQCQMVYTQNRLAVSHELNKRCEFAHGNSEYRDRVFDNEMSGGMKVCSLNMNRYFSIFLRVGVRIVLKKKTINIKAFDTRTFQTIFSI